MSERELDSTQDRTSKWGETVDDISSVGKVRLILEDVTVEADTIEDARVLLAYKTGVEIDRPADELWLQRYHQTYFERKIKTYTALRTQIVAQRDATKSEKERQQLEAMLIIIDGKLQHFATLVASSERERQ